MKEAIISDLYFLNASLSGISTTSLPPFASLVYLPGIAILFSFTPLETRASIEE